MKEYENYENWNDEYEDDLGDQPLLSTPLMEAPQWLLGRLRRPAEPEPVEAKPFVGETSERAREALERACAALTAARPGTRDATIGQVVYRVGRLSAAGELDPESALAVLLKAMASNPGTDKSHCAKVERCFRDGFKNPAEPGPIDDRHATEDDFGAADRADDHRDGCGASERHDDDSRERAASESRQQQQQPTSTDWDPIDLDLFLGGSDLPPPELSDDALPQGWAEIIHAFAAVAEAPPDYVAIAAIAGAAGAIGNACVVEGKRGWREPGRGHLSLQLRRAGLDVVSFDLHRYADPLVHDIAAGDIRRLTTLEGFAWVITNLPYSDLEELATHLIGLGDRDRCGVALLVRTEWIVPKARRRLVHEHPHFAGTVMLTTRPRWVERVQDSASPRHNFAWGVWGAAPRIGDPWLRFAGRDVNPARR